MRERVYRFQLRAGKFVEGRGRDMSEAFARLVNSGVKGIVACSDVTPRRMTTPARRALLKKKSA